MWVHEAWLKQGVLAAMSGEAEGDCGWEGAPAVRDAAFAPLGVPVASIGLLQQVHGVAMQHATEADLPSASKAEAPVADGWMTAMPGLSLGILVADCVPVWIVAPEARVGAVVHAGREGTRQAIVQVAVTQLVEAWGIGPAQLEAYIGPSAGPCCYEVSAAMAASWRREGGAAEDRKLDLWQTNRGQLEVSGIPATQIGEARHCTICQGGYHSYRKSGSPCRNLALLRFLPA